MKRMVLIYVESDEDFAIVLPNQPIYLSKYDKYRSYGHTRFRSWVLSHPLTILVTFPLMAAVLVGILS